MNETRVGELAAETLISTGARHYAYYGPPHREYYVDNLLRGFRQVLASAGFNCSWLDDGAEVTAESALHGSLESLGEALRSLSKPAGVLCWNSVGAHFVSEACAWAGVKVPEEVSVLAGDHDLLLAEIAQPRLTCIDHAPRRVGYLAAAELDRLMQGGTAEAPVLVEPEGVIARDSVARVHVKDELVAEVIDIIRANAGRNITIQYLIDTVAVSRRNLERRFRQALGRGPAAEIRRLRLIEARSLLAETSLPIKQIAIQCGFANPEQLQRLLRSETGLTPVQYRNVHRRNIHPVAVSSDLTTTKNRDRVHRSVPKDLGNRIDERSTRVPLTPSLNLSHLESRKPPFVS